MKTARLSICVLVTVLVAEFASCRLPTEEDDEVEEDNGLLDSTLFSSVAEQLGQVSRQHFEPLLNFSFLKQVYSNETADVQLNETDGMEAVVKVADQLAAYFQSITELLKNSTALTEELYTAHLDTDCCSQECIAHTGSEFSLSSCCQDGNCRQICRAEGQNDTGGLDFEEPQLEFYRAMVVEQEVEGFGGEFEEVRLREEALFDRRVDLDNTALHYPLDIFDRDPRVLCFAQWSQNLTAHYQEQYQELKVTQYFGSSAGILRFYPASDWSLLNQCYRCPLDQVDTYDSRHRPWYINTVPGSKFLVLILDTSGSMTGFRLLLAKIIAQQLLLSLSQNDFFLVLEVNESETPASLMGCFDNKTRATPENILTINEIIESITKAEGRVTSFQPALQMAAQRLADEPECHGLVAVLSDQDSLNSDLAQSIDAVDDEAMARVFIFLTGFRRDTVFDSRAAIEQASARTGGRVFQVQQYSDIMPYLREFTNCLRSLTPLDSSREEVFFNHYKDVFGGLTLSASQPLYIREEESEDNCNGSFVGVSGVDVDLLGMKANFFRDNLGPFSYWFMVDNNGQLLVHPLINYDYIRNLSGDDLIALEVRNFEHPQNSSEFEEVRRAMLDREAGNRSLVAMVPINAGEEFQFMNVTYFYAPVNGTPFSMAIVMPADTLLRKPPLVNFTDLLSKFEMYSRFVAHHVASERSPCSILSSLSLETETERFLSELIKLAGSADPIPGCSQELYEQLLFDLSLSYSVMENIPILPKIMEAIQSLRDFSILNNLTSYILLQFPTGLSLCAPSFNNRILRSIADESNCPVSILSHLYIQDIILQSGGTGDIVYYHSVENMVDTLVAARVLEQNGDTPGMDSGTSVSTSSVLGVNVSRSQLSKDLKSAVQMEEQKRLSVVPGSTAVPDSTGHFYLLESRGEILATSGGSQSSGHFRDLYPDIFQELVDMGVYMETVILGSEVRPCADFFLPTTGCSDSSSLSMYRGILLSVANTVHWVIGGGLWTVIKLGFMSVQTSLHQLVLGQEDTASPEEECPVSLCQRKTVIYQLQLDQSTPVSGSCVVNDTQIFDNGFQAAVVPNTNLLLVEVRSSCQISDTPTEPYDLVDVTCPCMCQEATPIINDTCTGYRRELGDACFNVNSTRTCCSATGAASRYHIYTSLLVSLPFLLYIMST